MANHKSAAKRAKQNLKKQARNTVIRTKVKNAIKSLHKIASDGSGEEASVALNAAKSTIHKAAKNGVLHQSNASRKIARLSKLVNTMSA